MIPESLGYHLLSYFQLLTKMSYLEKKVDVSITT